MKTMRCGEWTLNPRDEAWSYLPTLTASIEGDDAGAYVVVVFELDAYEVIAMVGDGETIDAEFTEPYPDRRVPHGEEVEEAFESVLGAIGDFVGCEFPAELLRLPKTMLALIGADEDGDLFRVPLCSVCHTMAPCSRHGMEVV